MALLVKDIPIDGVVMYSTEEYAASIFLNGFLSPIGVLLDAFVLYVLLRQRSIPISSQMIISLCVGDLLVGIPGGFFGLSDLIYGGWSHGPFGCIVAAEIMVFGAGISIFSLLCLTLERYLLIIKNIALTQKQTFYILVLIWTLIPAAVLYPVYLGYSPILSGLGPSKLLCAVAWWSNYEPAKVAIYGCFAVILSSVFVINYCYSIIWLKYSHTERERNQVLRDAQDPNFDLSSNGPSSHGSQNLKSSPLSTQGTPASKLNLSSSERRLLIKCMLITGTQLRLDLDLLIIYKIGSFMICWAPMLIRIFFEAITNSPVSSGVDIFCTILSASSCAVNSIILITQDARMSSVVQDTIGWSKNREEMTSKHEEIPITGGPSSVDPVNE